MKVLIAYDGSDCSQAAMDGLQFAGLPERATALVISVAETREHLPAELLNDTATLSGGSAFSLHIPGIDDNRDISALDSSHAQRLAKEGAARLSERFPKWNVDFCAVAGHATNTLTRRAASWKPDLAVLGSHGKSAFSRLMLGSLSRSALTDMDCSVRIGRPCSAHAQEGQPPRLLIGVDGSEDADAALGAICSRHWPDGTEARVVGVVDTGVALLVPAAALADGIAGEDYDEFRSWISPAVDDAARRLQDAGLSATPVLRDGRPAQVLLREAEEWSASCVFLGARGLRRMERSLLGSISAAVASRASCSVEIVRPAADYSACQGR